MNQWLGSGRYLWNTLLASEQAEYKATGKFLWAKELQPMALALKRAPETAWLADLPAHAVLDTVQRLDAALRRMCHMRKRATAERWSKEKRRKMCGFPRFKKKFVREAGVYCVGQATEIGDGFVVVPKMGKIRISGGDVPQGRLLAARIMRDGDRWMLSAQFVCKRPEPLPVTGGMSGTDLGVATLATTFDGTSFTEEPAAKRLRASLKRLRRAQRAVSRRKKGSNRRRVAVQRVTCLHRKVRCQRSDALHQLSHRLTAKADVIKVETLNVAGMIANRRLALSVADAGMGTLLRMIDYKADWRGRTVVKIDPWFPSSQLCSNPNCGALNPAMKDLSRRTFECAACGHTEGRDRNAARNIYHYGEEPWCGAWNGGNARGEGVSHRATGAVLVETRSLVENVN